MLDKNNIIDTSIDLTFNPKKHDIDNLAKCFNYRGALPQSVVDKIVNSYDAKTMKFTDVTVRLDDFCKGYDSKILVNKEQLDESIKEVYKKF